MLYRNVFFRFIENYRYSAIVLRSYSILVYRKVLFYRFIEKSKSSAIVLRIFKIVLYKKVFLYRFIEKYRYSAIVLRSYSTLLYTNVFLNKIVIFTPPRTQIASPFVITILPNTISIIITEIDSHIINPRKIKVNRIIIKDYCIPNTNRIRKRYCQIWRIKTFNIGILSCTTDTSITICNNKCNINRIRTI